MTFAAFVLAALLQPGGIIAWLIIGLLAGFIASVVVKGGGYGLIGDIIVGLVGAFIGGILTNVLVPDATFGFWGSLIVAIIGAVILIAILRAIGRGRAA